MAKIGNKIFRTAAAGLRRSIARLTRIMCTIRNAAPEYLEPLSACRLIPLDQIPGMRPIGIREVTGRIMGTAATSCLRSNMINKLEFATMH